MNCSLTPEQRLIIDTTRAFVEAELYPNEAEIESHALLRETKRTLGLAKRGLAA
jgi:acyl-CoA dehydrogenase